MNSVGKTIVKFTGLFLLASFLGWVYEIVCVWTLHHIYVDRGILHLPMCPIYGFGFLVLYAMFHKVKNPLYLFVFSFLVTSVIELSASYILEYKFHMILWTYEGWPLNFQNRISVVSSMLFGVMTVLFTKGVKPPVYCIFDSKFGRAAIVLTVVLVVAGAFWQLWLWKKVGFTVF